MILAPGTKHQRNNIKRKLAAGKIPLRVIGSQSTGFRLAGQVGDKVIPVGNAYTKQTTAISVGHDKYGTKATKVVNLDVNSTFSGILSNSTFAGEHVGSTAIRHGKGSLTTIGA